MSNQIRQSAPTINIFLLFLVGALAILAPVAQSSAANLFASSAAGGAGELYLINPVDGSLVQDIGPLNDSLAVNYPVTGLAFNPVTGLLYGSTGNNPATTAARLIMINTNTAEVTVIGSFNAGPVNGSGTPATMTDMAFDSFGNLYGVGSIGGPQLYSINITTGQATVIGGTGLTSTSGGGLAINSGGIFYGTPTSTRFGTYDSTLGSFANIAAPTRPVGGAYAALSFDENGTLFGLNLGSALDTVLVTFNPATGAITNLGVSIYQLDAIAFQQMPQATLVSVTASIATANEQGPVNGQFTLTRSGDTSGPLAVSYGVAGTAIAGTDYTALSGTANFLPGATSTNLPVTVTDDPTPEFTETVILTINNSPNYGIGTGSATVSILDNESPEIAFGTTATNKLLESYAPSKATLQLVRRGLLTPALTLNLSYSGVATRGADFNGPLSVSLAANAAATNIALTSINNQLYSGNKLAVASVATGGYSIGTTNSAYVLVIDDENPPGAVLFSDDFNGVNSSSLWKVNLADPDDAFVDFNWDYSAVGIPVAPATTDGTRLGMRFRCGNTFLELDGLSVSPLNGNFTGDYRLKFDMWINYNGPMPDGGAGSTQNFNTGAGTTGEEVVWFNNPSADSVWFSCTGDGADGNTDGDYTAYLGFTQLKDDTGVYSAGTGAGPNTGIRNSSDPFYSLWGGQAAPAAQLALYPNQTGVANLGNAGMAWHTVVVSKFTNVVTWAIDGIVIASVTNDPGNLSTNVFVGYHDKFSGGAVSDVPAMSFGLVDNLYVETYVSAPIVITSIQIVGGNVEISFTGPAGNVASDFKLQSAGTVNGTYTDDNSATLSNIGSGSFKASTALSGDSHYYKIKL